MDKLQRNGLAMIILSVFQILTAQIAVEIWNHLVNAGVLSLTACTILANDAYKNLLVPHIRSICLMFPKLPVTTLSRVGNVFHARRDRHLCFVKPL